METERKDELCKRGGHYKGFKKTRQVLRGQGIMREAGRQRKNERGWEGAMGRKKVRERRWRKEER